MAFVVGLTGGIGSGKSTVSNAFSELGIEITDTDRLAHALTSPGEPGHDAIVRTFGSAALRADGTLDRTHLRNVVFADAAERARLETILHPLIRDAAAREVASWTGVYGILVVPLLFERGGLRGIMQRALVVDCPEHEQMRRVIARTGMSEGDVAAIMATQLSRGERLARADDVLDNSGAAEAIPAQVRELDRRYRALATAAASH